MTSKKLFFVENVQIQQLINIFKDSKNCFAKKSHDGFFQLLASDQNKAFFHLKHLPNFLELEHLHDLIDSLLLEWLLAFWTIVQELLVFHQKFSTYRKDLVLF